VQCFTHRIVMTHSQWMLVNSKQKVFQVISTTMGGLNSIGRQGCALFLLFVLLPHAALAENPRPGWKDSYSVNGQCYCDSNFDHGIGSQTVNTPQGRKSVRQVCATIGRGPGSRGNPVYNDIQCGNGPPNNAGDEDRNRCPGRVDMGSRGCQITGPTWNLNRFYSTTTSDPTPTTAPTPAPAPELAPEPTPEPAPEPESTNLVPVLPDIPDQTVRTGDTLNLLVIPQDPEGFAPNLYLLQAPDGVLFNDNRDGSRTLTWQPSELDAGQYDVIVVAQDALDNSLTTERLIRIDVVNSVPSTTSNSTPVIDVIDAATTTIGQQIDVLVNPTDPDGIVPSVYLENAPADALFVDNLNGTRTLRWTPGPESIGIHEIRAVAQDGIDPTLTTTRTFTITVLSDTQPSSGAIYFTGIAPQSITLGQTLEFVVQAIDPDGTIPWLHVDNPPVGASFRDNLNGTRTFSWTPAASDTGTREIRFIALDSQQPETTIQLLVPVEILDPG
jgi:hypothetical protein